VLAASPLVWFGTGGVPVAAAPLIVVCLALAQWLAMPSHDGRVGRTVSVGVGLVIGWFALHAGLTAWIDVPPTRAPASVVVVATMLWFVALYAVQAVIAARPGSAFARSLYPWFYAGLYLDELATRATFRIWPVRSGERVDSRVPSALGEPS
jgi:NAD(P)H-quinone oxidoreductase subunit 5